MAAARHDGSAHVEARYVGDHSPTMESPTIESRDLGASTMETPTLESRRLRVCGRLVAMPAARAVRDQTEEINLEDLGLDLTGLDEAAGDLGTGVHGALDEQQRVRRLFDLGTPRR